MADPVDACPAVDRARHAETRSGLHQIVIGVAKVQIAVDRAALGNIKSGHVVKAGRPIVQIDVAVDRARIDDRAPCGADRIAEAGDRTARQIGQRVIWAVTAVVGDGRACGAGQRAAVGDGGGGVDGIGADDDRRIACGDGPVVRKCGGAHPIADIRGDRAVIGHAAARIHRRYYGGAVVEIGETYLAIIDDIARLQENRPISGPVRTVLQRHRERAIIRYGQRRRKGGHAGLHDGGLLYRHRVGGGNRAVEHHIALPRQIDRGAEGAVRVQRQRRAARDLIAKAGETASHGQRRAFIAGHVIAQHRIGRADRAVDPGIATGAAARNGGDQRVSRTQREVAVEHAAHLGPIFVVGAVIGRRRREKIDIAVDRARIGHRHQSGGGKTGYRGGGAHDQAALTIVDERIHIEQHTGRAADRPGVDQRRGKETGPDRGAGDGAAVGVVGIGGAVGFGQHQPRSAQREDRAGVAQALAVLVIDAGAVGYDRAIVDERGQAGALRADLDRAEQRCLVHQRTRAIDAQTIIGGKALPQGDRCARSHIGIHHEKIRGQRQSIRQFGIFQEINLQQIRAAAAVQRAVDPGHQCAIHVIGDYRIVRGAQ